MPRKPSTLRGGNGRIFFESAKVQGPPEHLRDVALASQAHEVVRRRRDARRLNGEPHLVEVGVARVLRGLCKLLADRPYGVLTEKQRSLCMRVLKLTELPPLKEAEVPEVLRNLPKKPPGRISARRE